ncbi:MAG TPA: ABC transporter permease [Longimicrobiales bacterium]
MSVLRRLWRRTSQQVSAEVEAEIGFHLEARVAELERAGLTSAEARAEALRRFGDVSGTIASCVASDLRTERRVERRELLREVVQDARLGVRQLVARPGFAALCVLTLGAAIGAAASIYAVADHVLLRPLPYVEPDRVVTLWEVAQEGGRFEVSPGNYVDWRERARSFSVMGLAEPFSMDLTGEGAPQVMRSWRVTAGFFAALGVRPVIGRTFTDAEYESGAAVALVSHASWQQRFGGDGSVIGRVITLDGAGFEIVGVLPPSLEYPAPEELWTPKTLSPDELADRRSAYMHAVARLAPGVTAAQAQAEMDVIAAGMAEEHAANRGRGVAVVPLETEVLGSARPIMLALLLATGLLLLIACANLMNLLISRGMDRGGELAVRSALGAGRWRLVRQLMTESIVLSACGGAVGIALAYAGIRALVALAPADLPRLGAVAFDARVLAFLIAVTVISAALFGGLPAFRLSRSDPMSALRGGRTRQPLDERLRRGIASAAIAFCFVLLIAAGLLTRSLLALIDNELGFETRGRATVQLFLWDRNPTPEQRIIRVRELIERFEAIPGAARAAAVSSLPFHPHAINSMGGLIIEGAPPEPGESGRRVFTTVVTPAYFDVMGIRLLAGRHFSEADQDGTTPVVIINDRLAHAYFPNESPIGRRIRGGVMAGPVTREIVGVVAGVRASSFDSEPAPELFIPHAQHGTGSMTFIVHGNGAADPMMPAMREAVWSIDPTQTIYYGATIDQLVSRTLAQRNFQLVLTTAFGIMALALVVLGVYAVVSLWARERRRELGIRVALGARSRDIFRLVLSQSLRIAWPGLLFGAAAALALTRGFTHMLYEVAPTDRLTFILAASVLLLASALAACVPARGAVRTDPARSLHAD